MYTMLYNNKQLQLPFIITFLEAFSKKTWLAQTQLRHFIPGY
jgi:hypothetical protein